MKGEKREKSWENINSDHYFLASPIIIFTLPELVTKSYIDFWTVSTREQHTVR